MKKLTVFILSILILLALVDSIVSEDTNESLTSRNITARVLEVNDYMLYVEVLTGLHLDRVYITTTTSSSIYQSFKSVSPNDILVVSVSEMENIDGSVLLIADQIELPGN